MGRRGGETPNESGSVEAVEAVDMDTVAGWRRACSHASAPPGRGLREAGSAWGSLEDECSDLIVERGWRTCGRVCAQGRGVSSDGGVLRA